jgi:hypothetical protein
VLNETETSDLHSSFSIINTTDSRNDGTLCSLERRNMKCVEKLVSEHLLEEQEEYRVIILM